MRVEARFTDRAEVQQIKWLQSALGVRKNARVLRDALTLFAWAVREVLAGRRVASVDPEGRSIREFSTPLLERASWANRQSVVLSAEAIRRVSDLLAGPPEPTAKLRKLMKTKVSSG